MKNSTFRLQYPRDDGTDNNRNSYPVKKSEHEIEHKTSKNDKTVEHMTARLAATKRHKLATFASSPVWTRGNDPSPLSLHFPTFYSIF